MALPSKGYESDPPRAVDVKDTKMLDPYAREDPRTQKSHETGKSFTGKSKSYGKGGASRY
jgi:hypothetical protein